MSLMKRKADLFDNDLWDFPSRMFEGGLFRDRDMPAVNIKDTGEAFAIEVAAPGYDKDELKVKVEQGILTISSEKKAESREEKEGYTRQEFSYSSFSRSFHLPDTADEDAMKPSYTDGSLKLTIGKKKSEPASKEKHIPIG